MKKLLEKLETMVEIKLLQVNETKGVYAGSIAYDYSFSDDSSANYDTSYANDYCVTND